MRALRPRDREQFEGAELDVSVGTVHKDFNAELLAVRDVTRAQTENWRDLERMRMDTILRMLHPVLTGPHALRVQAGRVLVQLACSGRG